MIRHLRVTLILVLAAGKFFSGWTAPQGKELNNAAGLYHQARYDSALAKLERLKDAAGWKKRDSLALFQYLGMASAKLGKDSSAVGYFSGLLRLDSLFQFPENEDAMILRDFSQAKSLRNTNVTDDPSAHPSVAALGTPAPPFSASASASASAAVPSASGQPDFRLNAQDSKSGFSASPKRVGFAYGALPLGAGWLMRDKTKHGVALGLLQAGGILLSIYASHVQTSGQDDPFRIENDRESERLVRWQWVQRVSLSTALGAYLFSLIAGAGE